MGSTQAKRDRIFSWLLTVIAVLSLLGVQRADACQPSYSETTHAYDDSPTPSSDPASSARLRPPPKPVLRVRRAPAPHHAGGDSLNAPRGARWVEGGASRGWQEGLDDVAKYDLIRASKTDVGAISRYTKWSEAQVQRVKQHLFYEKHLLESTSGRGMSLRRFDPMERVATLWQKARTGALRGDDVAAFNQLMRHEMVESSLMRHGRLLYREAHETAHLRFGTYGKQP